MRIVLLFFVFLPALLWSQRYQLANPRIITDSVFFRQSATVRLELDIDSVTIGYTTDGSFPLDKALPYEKPLVLKESATVRARAAHPEFLPSSFAEKQFIHVTSVPDSFRLATAPDSAYSGRGGATLFDLQKGDTDLHSGRWLGFRKDTVQIDLYFKAPVSTKVLLFSTLFDSGAWIFPPASIEVYGSAGNKEMHTIGVWSARPDSTLQSRSAKYELYQRVVVRPTPVDRMRIRVVPFGPLPVWHAGAGKEAWLFLDEILFQ